MLMFATSACIRIYRNRLLDHCNLIENEVGAKKNVQGERSEKIVGVHLKVPFLSWKRSPGL